MCRLTYEEYILLDNLIYLELNAKENESIINIVIGLINYDDFDYLMSKVGNCIVKMPKSEWIELLKQILNKPNLQKLRMININSYYNNKMKYACFIDDEDNVIVVFRGTSTSDEWDDNGQSAYTDETMAQIDALNFINSLDYENITVTGHSKGGNKAQFVSILSPKVSNCISINGQGFSNEFLNKYTEEIKNSKSKIICINAKYDYVSCLFNSISEERHYIKTEIQLNPFDYHKASILLDQNGNLRPETKEAGFSKIINDFSNYLISDLPQNMSKLIINKVIDVIELVLCEEENNKNLLKAIGEQLLLFSYENYLKYQEVFNIGYTFAEGIILPLLFWDDFIYIEETKSKDYLDEILKKINSLGSEAIKKIELTDKKQTKLINNFTKAIKYLLLQLQTENFYN